jgi:conjugal transfer mating pair stabilization protein TraN
MKNIILVSMLGLLCVKAMANQEQSFNDTANWAKQTSQSMLTPSSIPLNINDYCKDASCQSKVANPSETSLNDGNMEDKKAEAMANDELAQGIQANTNKERPDFKNDQQMRYALIGQENAYEISHDVSNKYVNCDSGEQCLFDDYDKICHAPTNTPVPCSKVPSFTPDVRPAGYKCNSGWTLNGYYCTRPVVQCRFDGRANYVQYRYGRDTVPVTIYLWDGVHHGSGKWKGPLQSKRELGERNYVEMYTICGYVTESTPAIPQCTSGYALSGANCVKNDVSWETQCTLISECKAISETCVEPGGTRTINGVPMTLPCWKYEINHLCELPDNCGQFSECREGARECSLQQNGVCIEEKITKICTEKTCRQVTLQCGEQSFCLDGDCYDSTPKRNDEFDRSAAALAGLGEAAKGLGDPPKIFTGKPMQCSKKPVGIADCCKDGGWGTDIGLAQCSEEDKAVGKAKEKGLTIYVGEYCAEKILGVCIRKKKSYCAYDSKLGKIIQQQGALNQLGKTLGSAENPTCAPLTPEELSNINFDHIDFTEFYPELHDNINLPDPNIIKQRIQSAVGG